MTTQQQNGYYLLRDEPDGSKRPFACWTELIAEVMISVHGYRVATPEEYTEVAEQVVAAETVRRNQSQSKRKGW